MKRNLSTKKIIAEIEKHNLEFSHEKNKIVVSTNEHFEALKSALCRIRRYYSKNISVKEVTQDSKLIFAEATIMLPVGREEILKDLQGKEYEERYGRFTTSDGEVFFTDDFGEDIDLPMASFYELFSEEHNAKRSLDEAIDDLMYCNREADLVKNNKDNPRYKKIIEAVDEKADALDACIVRYRKSREAITKTLKEFLQ